MNLERNCSIRKISDDVFTNVEKELMKETMARNLSMCESSLIEIGLIATIMTDHKHGRESKKRQSFFKLLISVPY